MAKRGQPARIYDGKTADKILKSVEAGNFVETAAAVAGVDGRTIRRWVYLGSKGREPYRAFAQRLASAEALAEHEDIANIRRAGANDWRALAWRLERKSPKRWGFRVRLEVQEELESFLDRLKSKLTPELYEQVLSAALDDAGEATADLPEDGEGAVH